MKKRSKIFKSANSQSIKKLVAVFLLFFIAGRTTAQDGNAGAPIEVA